MIDSNTYFAPVKNPCRHSGTADLLPIASDFIQSSLYSSTVKEIQTDVDALAGYRDQFGMWHMQLRAQFSVLLHGFGCKSRMLSQFANEYLTEGGLVEVNAWRAKVTAKQILTSVLSSLFGIEPSNFRSMSTEALIDRIAAEDGSAAWVNLVIHSLDARFLRQHEEHVALSRLAACRAVRMIASIDHPNSGVLHDFDVAQRSQMCWHHVPTMLPLWSETWEIEPSIQPRQTNEAHVDAIPVLQTLTQNSQHVFCTLITVLLGEILSDDDEIVGVTYEHLFRVCRERLLVSSDETLKAHLTEYKDHDLLKRRKTPDGAELLYVPLPVPELQRLLEELQLSVSNT